MRPEQGTLMVGIAGGSGSGKTHFARSVAEAVGRKHVEVLSMDQYFRSRPKSGDGRDVNFDHPAHLDFQLMVAHLRELRKGESVSAPTYDFLEMVQRPGSVSIRPKPVIIVEGLFALAKPIVDHFDISYFLDVDADQRLLGRFLRDVKERGATIEDLVDRYQRFVRPSYEVFVAPSKQNADVVVDFTYRRILFTRMLTTLLTTYVRGGFDLRDFVREMRAECDHLGFTPRDGSMPVSIDIGKLADTYPESVSAKPVLGFEGPFSRRAP